jgi:hypothetical protein
VAPKYLCQVALQLISSNVHYYEDVSNVNEDTQVLNPVFLWPLHLFCFNFVATYRFHHYVVDQTFYLRQILLPWVLSALRKYGVRFNNLETFPRANRFRFFYPVSRSEGLGAEAQKEPEPEREQNGDRDGRYYGGCHRIFAFGNEDVASIVLIPIGLVHYAILREGS